MKLFLEGLQNQIKEFIKNNIRLRFIGDLTRFPVKHQQYIAKAQQSCANNRGMIFVAALNYGGQWDIVQAVKQVAKKVAAGKLLIDEINDDSIAQYLTLADLPNPDLLIRTSGEQRISNFFLWQLAYTELYFIQQLWPDFTKECFQAALDDYAKRQRRFGRV